MNIAIHQIVNEEIGLPCVVYGIGLQEKQCHIVRNEGYNIHQIIFSSKGNGVLKVNGKEEKIQEGSCFYLKPNESHEYYKESNQWETYWIMFAGENIENTLKELSMDKTRVFYNQNNIIIKKIFSDIIVTLKSADKHKAFVASNYLYNLLIELYRNSEDESNVNNESDRELINPIIDYINNNFYVDIELETLANIANVTPQYLCKVFKKKLFMRPFEYITKCRIQEAKKLLTSTDMTIKDISIAVGYRDNSYFCATFKKYESISPSQFRGSL